MLNKQSFVVEMLGLEVSEEINTKLVNAELKLAQAVLSKNKVRDAIAKVHKILKENDIKFNTEELNKCIDVYKTHVKETGGEFSTRTKEVIPLEINRELFKECGLNIDINKTEGDVIEVIEPLEVSYIDDEEYVNDDETSVHVHQFVLKNIDDELRDDVKTALMEIDKEFKELNTIIYWSLRGRISIDKVFEILLDLFNTFGGGEEIKFIKPFIKPISKFIKSLDKSILTLSELSSSTDIEMVEETFNKCVDKTVKKSGFIKAFTDTDIESYVKFILLCALDSFICADICNVSNVKDISDEEVNEFMTKIGFIITSAATHDSLLETFKESIAPFNDRNEGVHTVTKPTSVKIRNNSNSCGPKAFRSVYNFNEIRNAIFG